MGGSSPDVQIKRVYDAPDPSDGYRVLVDRLWPRGVAKERAAVELWLKDAAPSPTLRTWWNHDPARLGQFAERYRLELDTNPALGELCDLVRRSGTVTLLYAAHDPQVNHALVLRDHVATVMQDTGPAHVRADRHARPARTAPSGSSLAAHDETPGAPV